MKCNMALKEGMTTAPGSLDSDMEVEMFLYLARIWSGWVVLSMYKDRALYFGQTSTRCCFKHQEHVDCTQCNSQLVVV